MSIPIRPHRFEASEIRSSGIQAFAWNNPLMAIFRIQARWSGFTGAPGYSAFHFDAATAGAGPTPQACADAVRTLLVSWGNYLPGGVSVAVESEVQRLEESTGTLIGFEQVTPGSAVSGSGTSSYSAATGAVIIWNTAGVRRGRRIQGRSFVVPVSGAALTSTGQISTPAQTALQSGATAFADSITGPVVWARPSGPGASDGQIASITAARVPTKVAVLRSRRD